MYSFKDFISDWMSTDCEELPFEEPSYTKEQCFELCRKTYTVLENAGCRPYTLFRFRDYCNTIARRHGTWKEYYEHCAKYVEFYVYKDFSQNRFNNNRLSMNK